MPYSFGSARFCGYCAGSAGRRIGFAGAATVAVVFGLAGCGGSDSAAPAPPPDPPRATAISVSPSSAMLQYLGETVRFTARITDQYGAAFPGTVTWSSSDPAVVTVAADGSATAVANGSGTVVASFSGLSASASVTVRQVAGSVEVISGDGQLGRPESPLSQPVVVRVVDQGGAPVEGIEVSFAGDGSASPASMTSDTSGVAQTEWTLGTAEGTQTLTAGVTNGPSVQVTATAERLPLIQLTEDEASSPEGGAMRFSVQADPAPRAVLAVRYTLGTDDDPATADADGNDYFGQAAGTLEIGAGETSAVIEIGIQDDDDIEPTREVFVLTLSAPAEDDGYVVGETLSATAVIHEGVCDRTPLVRDEIVRLAGDGSSCASVTDEGLQSVRELVVRGPQQGTGPAIDSLKAADFAGLSELEQLDLRDNRLARLPSGVFGGLLRLELLDLSNNEIRELRPDAFAGLDELRVLHLTNNRLRVLQSEVFRELSKLGRIELGENQLAELPPGIFADTHADLETGVRSIVDVSSNELTVLAGGIFDNGGIEEVLAGNNQIAELHGDVFDGASRLAVVGLEENRVARLPVEVFRGPGALQEVRLQGNQLGELPDGIFEGLGELTSFRLDDNPGTPFPLVLALARADTTDLLAPGPASLVVEVATGAPFEIEIGSSVENGSPVQASFLLPAGQFRSQEVAVTRTSGSTAPTRVEISAATTPPDGFTGFQMRVTRPLTLFAKEHNESPRAVGSIRPHILQVQAPAVEFDASDFFADDDANLVYEATTTNSSAVRAQVDGERVTVTPRGAGEAVVQVTATDPWGLSASQYFGAIVFPEPDRSSFDIDGFVVSGTPSQRVTAGVALGRAIERWEEVITGDLPEARMQGAIDWCGGDYHYSVNADDLMFFAYIDEIDGAGGTLARAGPCAVRRGSQLPTVATITFDVADLGNTGLYTIALHEMGHALGIGTHPWRALGFLKNPSLNNPGADTHFDGPQAISAFDAVGGAGYTAAKVPVENEAGPGSGDSHWRNSVFGPELMNPFHYRNVANPLSLVTIASLADLGYEVDVNQAESYSLPSPDAIPGMAVDRIHLGADVYRGPVAVIGEDGRVIRVIPGQVDPGR